MNEIDFFGCSFTEAPIWPQLPKCGEEFDLLLYSQHTQTTKPISNFLQFDLAYNFIEDYRVNNFGGGSFGNHVIKEILKNRINEIDKNNNNIAIVQLSALLRNPTSFEVIFNSEHSPLTKRNQFNITAFDLKSENVRNDYFVEVDDIESYYQLHINNIEEIISILKKNYKHYYIHFGWDICTSDFEKMWNKTSIKNEVNTWEYDFPITNLQYFENQEKYVGVFKKMKGKFGGTLEYSANKLDETLRYVHLVQDHHPSYFSNKIFYFEIIREFFKKILKLDKSYFEREDLQKFENYLSELLPTKESTDGRIYADFQVKMHKFINNNILI